jgi:hypothetical protein
MRAFVRNGALVDGIYRETAWDRSPNVRDRLSEPKCAEVVAAEIMVEYNIDLEYLREVVEGTCCEIVNLLQAGLIDVVEVKT